MRKQSFGKTKILKSRPLIRDDFGAELRFAKTCNFFFFLFTKASLFGVNISVLFNEIHSFQELGRPRRKKEELNH